MMSTDDTGTERTIATLTFCLQAETTQELANQVADVLAEHLRPEHDLHVSYASMPTGWNAIPQRQKNSLQLMPTTILFEYSVLIVLRERPA